MAYTYDTTYYEYINAGATRSAEHLVPIVRQVFDIRSVVDFGAGQGAWLAVWRTLGVTDVMGVDGDYVEPSALLVPPDRFIAADLGRPIHLGRRFDLVQSLEVAEHLPGAAAETFVDNLVAHGSIILFSAAVPGQGGEHHVNEQPYDYWRALFRKRNFVMLDVLRPAVAANPSVERWYRYNSFVFVQEQPLSSLPARIRRMEIRNGAQVPDVSPLSYRLRKAVIRMLPVAIATQLAIVKKHWYARRAASLRHG